MVPVILEKPYKRCYMIKNNVIYDINGDINSKDSCAIIVKKTGSTYTNIDKISQIKVTKDNKTKTYYLDSMLDLGDMVKDNKFVKTVHDSSTETTIELSTYYYNKCLEEIKNYLVSNPSLKYGDITESEETMSKIGVPLWMFQNVSCITGYSVTGVSRIPFKEENYDAYLKDGLQFWLLKDAQEKAKKYGYDVTELTVIKKG